MNHSWNFYFVNFFWFMRLYSFLIVILRRPLLICINVIFLWNFSTHISCHPHPIAKKFWVLRPSWITKGMCGCGSVRVRITRIAQVGWLRRCEFDMIPFKFSIRPAPCRPILLRWPRSESLLTNLNCQDQMFVDELQWAEVEMRDLTNDLTNVVRWFKREAASLTIPCFIQAFPYWEKPMSVSVAEIRGWRKV